MKSILFCYLYVLNEKHKRVKKLCVIEPITNLRRKKFSIEIEISVQNFNLRKMPIFFITKHKLWYNVLYNYLSHNLK